MGKYSEEELNQILSDTGKLLQDMPLPEKDYALDDILAEFGVGTASPVQEEEPPKREDDTASYLQEARQQEEQSREPHYVSVEDVMDRTVSAVLDEEAAARQEELLQEQHAERKARQKALGKARLAAATQFVQKIAVSLKSRRQDEDDEEEITPPEPSMDVADFEEKRLCRRYRGAALRCLAAAILIVGITAAEVFVPLPEIWINTPLLRFGAVGGLLFLEMLLALPLWKATFIKERKKWAGCGIGALSVGLVCLGDCVWCVLKGGTMLPLCGAAALVVFCCQWGLYLRVAGRRESFHLANIGGNPPWGVRTTQAGACKQAGRIEGFYTETVTDDLSQKWQKTALPLLLCVATVLTGVVCLSGQLPAQPFWIWSALLIAAVPLSAPLGAALPIRILSRRLSRSGCAVAGYCGAKAIGNFRRVMVTDEDLFPAGTLSLNGLKVYGEEIGRVLSYTVSMARLSDSQALPMLEQMLADEGGHTEQVDNFHWFEEGGVGGSIRGETVLLGSAYFMRKQKVRLPKEMKVATGLFLAVDGQLTAIFALRYQPSRNVDWALRALRRCHVTPVMAVRGCNVTPSLLRHSFKVNAKPIYPDVKSRLELLEMSKQIAPPHALLYRDGLMPLTETVLGSRKLVTAVRWTTVLMTLAAVSGLLLCYYLTGVGGFASLTPLRLILFQILWALPGLLLAGQIRFF